MFLLFMFCPSASYLSINLSCPSASHLSISISPVHLHLTCPSASYLFIAVLPVHQHLTCSLASYLAISVFPVHQHLTCSLASYLSISMSPVHQCLTCPSACHLSKIIYKWRDPSKSVMTADNEKCFLSAQRGAHVLLPAGIPDVWDPEQSCTFLLVEFPQLFSCGVSQM